MTALQQVASAAAGRVVRDASASATLRIATRCGSINEFIARFARFADETSMFIATVAPLGTSAERRFVFQLADGSAVMWGRGVVIEPRADQASLRGIRLRFLELVGTNRDVHQALLAARAQANGGPRLARGSIPPAMTTAPPRARPRSIPPPIPQATLRPCKDAGPLAAPAASAEVTEHDRWAAFLRHRPAAAQETLELPAPGATSWRPDPRR